MWSGSRWRDVDPDHGIIARVQKAWPILLLNLFFLSSTFLLILFFLTSSTILYEGLFRTRWQVGKREKRLEEFDIFPFPLAFPLALLPQSVDLTSCRSFTFDPSYRMWANFHSTLVDEGNAWCTCLVSPTHVGPPGDELSSCARQKSRPPGHLPPGGPDVTCDSSLQSRSFPYSWYHLSSAHGSRLIHKTIHSIHLQLLIAPLICSCGCVRGLWKIDGLECSRPPVSAQLDLRHFI